MKCEICGKILQFGHNVSHSKRRTGRTFRPNIQSLRLEIGGRRRKVNLCTRCLRTIYKVKG
ncbi:MAG: 50S ribosomal protein L28 [Chloroflexi bacterium]|nr:MAG: 50S ribosomal protein L28 [Chloroflexota bacterium]